MDGNAESFLCNPCSLRLCLFLAGRREGSFPPPYVMDQLWARDGLVVTEQVQKVWLYLRVPSKEREKSQTGTKTKTGRRTKQLFCGAARQTLPFEARNPAPKPPPSDPLQVSCVALLKRVVYLLRDGNNACIWLRGATKPALRQGGTLLSSLARTRRTHTHTHTHLSKIFSMPLIMIFRTYPPRLRLGGTVN